LAQRIGPGWHARQLSVRGAAAVAEPALESGRPQRVCWA